MFVIRPVIDGDSGDVFLDIDEANFPHPPGDAVRDAELSWRVRSLAGADAQIKPVVDGVFTEPVWVLWGHGAVVAFRFRVELLALHVAAGFDVSE